MRTTWVNEYWKRDGTHVSGHERRLPGGSVGGPAGGVVLLVAVVAILAMGGHLSSGAASAPGSDGTTNGTGTPSYPIKWPAWEDQTARSKPRPAAAYPIPWTTERAW
ncbi:hypothetical protein [Streptomyces sp. NPDC057910]|uniref:hypothetical protein n=1 Tax=Streptomyces sp. NPDC057910 TaxID=3346278 RepID=UPI0036EA8E89